MPAAQGYHRADRVDHPTRVARVARGSAQLVIERDLVAAREIMGLSRLRILTGEVLPNILGPMMVEVSLRLTYSIGVIAALGVPWFVV